RARPLAALARRPVHPARLLLPGRHRRDPDGQGRPQMNQPRSTYVSTAGHEVHVTEWGDPGRPALVMWHGLARTGRDFDEAASALSDTYFVICPDTIGRGLSGWARDPAVDYSYRVFGDTAIGLLDRYGIAETRWVGTSMGGLV